MLRTAFFRVARVSRIPAYRPFSVTTQKMGEGDTGAIRPGGTASNDPWVKKETAQENMYIRQQEIEKLRALKEKLKQQRQHLDELDAHIDELTRGQGGEQH